MRYFNTAGPCDPARHYTVMREALVAKGKKRVAQGRYFTIFAPRQAGKTTYFQLLFHQLDRETYTPIWISFEPLKTATRAEFYDYLTDQLRLTLAAHQLELTSSLQSHLDLVKYFQQLKQQGRQLVLVIDEFEGIPDGVVSELMHTFRLMYHQKDYYALQALILVGVSTLAELVVSSASPFNIADELKISYFSPAEVEGLIQQYVRESGQQFAPKVIQAIYHNTQGQPGLVCGLCAHLVEQVATDRSRPVKMADFYQTLRHFLTERFDKNILNIVQKARQKQPFMMRLLFGERPIPFTVNDPDIAFLYAHGVIDNVQNEVQIPVPLYSKALITAFRPTINGEIDYYFTSAQESLTDYATDKGLNIKGMLDKYQAYVQRRGFKAFDTDKLREGAWHYSLDGFLYFFIEELGGQTFIEVPTGRGRTDILILYQGQKYVIETKIYTDLSYFKKGKRQLADYLETEGLSEGYYIVFSNKHTEKDELYSEETVAGKQIYTFIIRTNFEPPSRREG